MTRRYWPLILVLAAVWGASYLFIKVGVDGGFSPGALMFARTLVAGLLLTAYAGATLGFRSTAARLREGWRQCVVLGFLNAAGPFWLVAWGEQHIDSGLAGIAQATVPLFSFLIGLPFLPHERIAPARWAGLGLGIAGVALIVGGAPNSGVWGVAGTLAVVLASVLYASAAIYGQLHLSDRLSGPVLATGCMLTASVMLLPLAVLAPPSAPTVGAVASLLALAILGTALAQLILFRVIALFGARKLSLVTYLMPGFALVYGAVVLGERVGPLALAGLALILVGVALGAGTVRLRRGATEAVGATRPSGGR
jgi:drug/metabolite transporter (DMT)-like permease